MLRDLALLVLLHDRGTFFEGMKQHLLFPVEGRHIFMFMYFYVEMRVG